MTIDRMLPGMDGLAIIPQLRDAGIDTPALIISALGEVDDRVRGLRGGGDDYLVKPFVFAELLARVEALAPTQRHGGERNRAARWRSRARSGFAHRQPQRRGNRAACRGNSKCSNIWSATRARSCRGPCCYSMSGICNFDPTTNIIDVYVGRVRRKVDNQHAYPLIHTVRGVGFCVRAHC